MEAKAIGAITALAGIVIIFTLVAGGSIGLGTSPSGPSFRVGFNGPSYRGNSLA